jgi:hypothetical protein
MPMDDPNYRLVPELVPEPLWGRNVRRALGKSQWARRIRKIVLDESGGGCDICGASYEKGMICHEVWHYDDTNRAAILTDFRIICQDCNLATHVGKAQKLGRLKEAISQLSRVNGISSEEARRLVDAAHSEWTRRSRVKVWEVNIDPDLKERYPALDNISEL